MRQVYDGALMPDLQANTFRNIDRLFSTRVVKRGSSVYPLPQSDNPLTSLSFSSQGTNYDLYDYVSLNRLSGLLVIKDGKIVLESYQLGNTESTRWNYSTGETQVVAALVSAATNRPVADYLSERIWAKFGMESDATWWLESPGGLEVGGSGLSATLRDYGRFGLFLLNGGVAGGEKILPDGWVEEASSPKMVNGSLVNYGYMLWPVPDSTGTVHEGAFEALGIFGQTIYMNPKENVVIAIWSARPKPLGKTTVVDRDFFAAVCKAVR